MSSRTVYLLAFLVSTIIATNAVSGFLWGYHPVHHPGSYHAPNRTHNLIVGNRVPGDRLVLRQTIFKSSSWFQPTVAFDKTYNLSRFDRITQVKALDQKTNGNGAFASIVRGGPGLSAVTLHFRSQKGHGINFIIEIYAKC